MFVFLFCFVFKASTLVRSPRYRIRPTHKSRIVYSCHHIVSGGVACISGYNPSAPVRLLDPVVLRNISDRWHNHVSTSASANANANANGTVEQQRLAGRTDGRVVWRTDGRENADAPPPPPMSPPLNVSVPPPVTTLFRCS